MCVLLGDVCMSAHGSVQCEGRQGPTGTWMTCVEKAMTYVRHECQAWVSGMCVRHVCQACVSGMCVRNLCPERALRCVSRVGIGMCVKKALRRVSIMCVQSVCPECGHEECAMRPALKTHWCSKAFHGAWAWQCEGVDAHTDAHTDSHVHGYTWSLACTHRIMHMHTHTTHTGAHTDAHSICTHLDDGGVQGVEVQ